MPQNAKATNTNTKTTEDNSSIKNFKQNSDIENFYRFIHENKLRKEAKVLMAMVAKSLKKSGRKRKAKTLN
ncbi:hypothetical protein N9N67_10770 [Bacteriovoracaceae bacterium]|nr:hypothetical protein [Bacteriovoracaceae bacterium]